MNIHTHSYVLCIKDTYVHTNTYMYHPPKVYLVKMKRLREVGYGYGKRFKFFSFPDKYTEGLLKEGKNQKFKKDKKVFSSSSFLLNIGFFFS